MNFDFDQAWGEIQNKNGEPVSQDQLLEAALRQKSKGTMEKLKYRLKVKLYWIIFFIVGLGAYALIRMGDPNSLLILGIMQFYMVTTGIFIYRYWKGMRDYPEMDGKLVDTLRFYRDSVRKALRIEENFGIFFLVASPVFGFLLAHFQRGGDFTTFVSEPKRLLLVLILVLIYAPIGILGSKWMNKKAYGKFMEKLDGNISELEVKGNG